jgi:predicted ABC-type ATPase
MGLHDVQPEKVRSRYKRSFDLLPSALTIADEAYIINNSENFMIVAEKRNNELFYNNPLSETLKKVLDKKPQ